MKRKAIILFQPYLRKHILDFEKAVTGFRFIVKSKKFASTKNFYKKSMLSPEKEFIRSKLGWKNKIRRSLGILNVRPKFTQEGDMLFTYGCLLLTNKPYCTYVENGAALFNYDPYILRNPLAQLYFSILIRLPQCKKLIFMSETAKQSLLATARFSRSTQKMIEKKSVQIYPFVKAPENVLPKKNTGAIKLLFTGIFYAKGGRELVNAFENVVKRHTNVTLTIVAPLHMFLPEDKKHIESIPEISLMDASFSPEEMEQLYREHDIFIFPTLRDTFGLVLIEALSFGMPIIATDQYATTEMAIHDHNAFVFPIHPILDYNQTTKEMFGKLYDAKAFYDAIFKAEANGAMKPLEKFIADSIVQFIDHPELLEQYSKSSLKLYRSKFHQDIVSRQIESVFKEATKE